MTRGDNAEGKQSKIHKSAGLFYDIVFDYYVLITPASTPTWY